MTQLLIISAGGGPFTGLFVYSPAPGFGNLIGSTAAANGTDPYGNAFLAGNVSYIFISGGTYAAIQQNGQRIAWLTAAAAGGPWLVRSIMVNNSFSVPANVLTIAAGSNPLLIKGGTTGGNPLTTTLLEVQGTTALQNTAAPAAVTGFAEPFASASALEVVDGLDGVTYDTERRTVLIPAQTISGATTLATITVAARAYRFKGKLLSANAVAADAMDVAFALSGGAAVSTFGLTYSNHSLAGGTDSPTGAVPTTFTATFTTSNANNGRQWLDIEGQVTFSSGGTWTLTANEHVGGNTISLFPSFMEVEPAVAP